MRVGQVQYISPNREELLMLAEGFNLTFSPDIPKDPEDQSTRI